MDSINWLSNFLHKRNLSSADARPLYAYRCSEEEYAELLELIKAIAPYAIVKWDHKAPFFKPLFCLYAAESWRRNHEGGSWKWETVLQEADLKCAPYPLITEWVQSGLSYWRRPLLRVSDQRAYLVTLACEGGLPLKLLHREGAKLRRYFKDLLVEFQRERSRGVEPMQLAERLGDRLPRSLRQQAVYVLSGQLIDSVWQLQAKLGESKTPIADLDRLEAGWRDQLPLRLEDETAEALLSNLMQDAIELSRQRPMSLRWRRYLVRVAEGWILEQRLNLPSSLSTSQLRPWLGQAASLLGVRFQLQATDRKGTTTTLALATKIRGGDDTVYRIESLHREGLKYRDEDAIKPRQLLVNQGSTSLPPLELPGGAALSDMLWVFIAQDDQETELQLLAEGSVRARQSSVFVMPPRGSKPVPKPGSTCELQGEVPQLDRELFRLTGTVTFTDPINDTCTIRCGQAHDTEEEFRLHGSMLPTTAGQDVFLGAPSVCRVQADGTLQSIASHRLEWRPTGDRYGWRPGLMGCKGQVTIRYQEEGELRFRTRANVLPKETSVILKPIDQCSGQVIIGGLGQAELYPELGTNVTVAINRTDANYQLDCKAPLDCNPTQFGVGIRWNNEKRLMLQLPFPARGGRFIAGDGRLLAPHERVPLDRLSGIKASALTPSGGMLFCVEGELRAKNLDPELQRLLWVREPLPNLGTGHYEMDLRILQERLEQMLSATDDLDAYVSIEIKSRIGNSNPIHIARFDLALQLDHEQNTVYLSENDLCRLGPEGLSRTLIEATPLWDPDQDPIPLKPDSSGCRWPLPQDLAPGPWLLIGRDGDWRRFRPLLWPVGEEAELKCEELDTELLSLAQAIRIPKSVLRHQALEAILDRLAKSATDPEWEQVFKYLELYRNLPPTVLDLIRHLALHPAATVMALLRAGEQHFDLVWSLAEKLPFSWFLIPLSIWHTVAQNFVDSLRQDLQSLDSAEYEEWVWQLMQPFFTQAPLKQEYQQIIVEWLQRELFPERKSFQRYLNMVENDAGQRTFLSVLEQSRRDLLSVHADDNWPQGPRVLEALNESLPARVQCLIASNQNYRTSVLNAPVTAALVSAWEFPYNFALLYEIRQLRIFDPDYFDHTYAIALSIALAFQLQSRPERHG